MRLAHPLRLMSREARADLLWTLDQTALARVLSVARHTGDFVTVRTCRLALGPSADTAARSAGARLLDTVTTAAATSDPRA